MKTVFLARSVPGSWIFTIGDAVAISNLLLSKSTWLLNDRRNAVCPRLRNCISGQHDAQRWKTGSQARKFVQPFEDPGPASLCPLGALFFFICDLRNVLGAFKP